MAGLLLGLESLIKLHYAFSSLYFKSTYIRRVLMHSFFKALEHLLTLPVEKAELTLEPCAGTRGWIKFNTCLVFVLFILTPSI